MKSSTPALSPVAVLLLSAFFILTSSCKVTTLVPAKSLEAYAVEQTQGPGSQLLRTLQQQVNELEAFDQIRKRLRINGNCPCKPAPTQEGECPCPPCGGGIRCSSLTLIDRSPIPDRYIQLVSATDGRNLWRPVKTRKYKIGGRQFQARTYEIDETYNGAAKLIVNSENGSFETELDYDRGGIIRED